MTTTSTSPASRRMGDAGPRGGDLVSASPSPFPTPPTRTRRAPPILRRPPGCRPMPAPARPRFWSGACLRLLLAGSEPQRVLCLTYTKMAAAEMQNRLLGELAAWATHGGRELAREACGASRSRGRRCGSAQRRGGSSRETLEAKGGLKIYTIHGFCERLLQRFPLEAQVTPHFAVLDESRGRAAEGRRLRRHDGARRRRPRRPAWAGARQDRGA